MLLFDEKENSRALHFDPKRFPLKMPIFGDEGKSMPFVRKRDFPKMRIFNGKDKPIALFSGRKWYLKK